MTLVNAFGNLALDSTVGIISSKLPTPIKNRLPVNTVNVSDTIVDQCIDFVGWTTSVVGQDILQIDGNTVAGQYIVFSLDPLSADTESRISYASTFVAPFHGAWGLSMSQRVVGQEFSVEYVSTETLLSPFTPVSISSISQTTTTLTVTTSTNHNLIPGNSVSISGITSDSRLNYPALVVATVPAANQFTATAGPGGTISSLTVGPYVGVGSVFLRSRLGYSPNGTSIIFENTTATNASLYTRASSGDALPSSTTANYVANHSSTVGTTASVQAINTVGSASFQPTNVYDYILDSFSITISDRLVDSGSSTNTVRLKRDQVTPDPNKAYQFRIRGMNNTGLTRPVAKVVSASKSGTTTVTITTDVNHGLTTGDLVNIYGVRDTTNFPNLTTSTAVASTPTLTTFTIVMGPAATATSNGGYISRVNGGVTQQGASTVVAQSISRTSNLVTVIGSGTWGATIGDYVNLHGVYDTSGVYLNLDGPYRVYNSSTTTLVLQPIGSAPTGADIVSINCGGTYIKRTDLRLHFFRLQEYQRLAVESYGGGFSRSDVGSSMPVVVNQILNTPSINFSAIGGATAISLTPNGSTNRALVAGIAGPTNNVDYSAQNWAAASGSGATIANTQGLGAAASFLVNVTAFTAGSSQGLDMYLQESPDNGGSWFDIWQTEAVTGVTSFRIPAIPIGGRRRFRWVNRGGAATTATVTINAMDLSTHPVKQVQWFDRTSGIGTGTAVLNTTTAGYDIAGCSNVSVVMQAASATSPASYKTQMSINGVNWYDSSNAVGIGTTAAANVLIPTTNNAVGRFVRVICTDPGTAQTMNAIHIYGT